MKTYKKVSRDTAHLKEWTETEGGVGVVIRFASKGTGEQRTGTTLRDSWVEMNCII